MGMKEFLSNRKNMKMQKKSAEAYDLMKSSEKYATSDEFMIKLQGDTSLFEPFFQRLKDEGYDYRIDTIDGELFSPTIIYVRIRKPGIKHFK